MIDQQRLGEAVRVVRKLRRLTQAELAEQIGVASNTIALLERGERAFSLKMLNALGKALGVPAACLAVMGSPGKRLKSEAASQALLKLQSLIVTTIKLEGPRKAGRRPAKTRMAAKKRARVA